ncbi:MAG TPA: methyltransferase domain-containing protein [Gammaproteobacteria bacterium]|nr:methyltransferase domain-containing protein [Gammaproteobacteria bacterium]
MSELMPDQVPEKWGDISGAYAKIFEPLTAQFAEEVLDRVQPKTGERLLDVAAGTGYFSLAAAKKGADVLATDFSEGMVKHLQQRIDDELIHNIQAKVMNGEALSVDDASFDISTSIVGLIFFPDIDQGFAELKRVLKPGGRCAVVCWDFPENFDMMKLLRQAIADAVPDFEMPTQTPVWARLCGTAALKEKFEQAGFRRVDVYCHHGRLKIDSPEEFWTAFIASSPPMHALFQSLGEDNTRLAGNAFVRLVSDGSYGQPPVLKATACIGIAYNEPEESL